MWPLVAIGECCEIISGSTPRTGIKEYWDSDIYWATPKDLSEQSFPYISTTSRKISKAGLRSCSANVLPVGSILFSSRAPIGLVAINTVEMCTNQGFKNLIPDESKVHNKYLYHWLKVNTKPLQDQGNGATFKELSKSIVAKVEIPLPPLPEQRRIAAILDKADAIRRKRQEALALTDEFLRSAFIEMFGDPVTNPKGWEEKPLDNLLVFITSGSRGWAKYYSDEGRLFLRIQNVGKTKLVLDDIAFVTPPEGAEAKRTLVKTGDVLLSITADLGRTCVIPGDLGPAHINQHLAILRVQGINPHYLSSFLASAGGQRQIQGLNKEGVKAGLNLSR